MLKPIFLFLLSSFLYPDLYAQDVPDVRLTDLSNNIFQTEKLNEHTGKPVVLAFWATWCIPCLNELAAISENLENWKAKTSFELYAISEDDSRTIRKVQPLVNGKGWNFTVLLDKNQELKRALNLANIPYTMVIKNGKIIYRHTGYVAGNENELFKVINENQ